MFKMVAINRDYRLEVAKELAAMEALERERWAKRAEAMGKYAKPIGKVLGTAYKEGRGLLKFLYKEVKGLAKAAYKETKQLTGVALDAHARADLYERINPDARFTPKEYDTTPLTGAKWYNKAGNGIRRFGKNRMIGVGNLLERVGTMVGNSQEFKKLEKIASDNKTTPKNIYNYLAKQQTIKETKAIEQLAIEESKIKKRNDFESAIRYQKRLNNLRAKILEKQADNKDAKDEIKKYNTAVKNYNNKLLDLRLDNPNQRLNTFNYLQTGLHQKQTKP